MFGSGMKNVQIRVWDKTSQICNTAAKEKVCLSKLLALGFENQNSTQRTRYGSDKNSVLILKVGCFLSMKTILAQIDLDIEVEYGYRCNMLYYASSNYYTILSHDPVLVRIIWEGKRPG
jgi:hypothetical protein